jgi:hypothetical protein
VCAGKEEVDKAPTYNPLIGRECFYCEKTKPEADLPLLLLGNYRVFKFCTKKEINIPANTDKLALKIDAESDKVRENRDNSFDALNNSGDPEPLGEIRAHCAGFSALKPAIKICGEKYDGVKTNFNTFAKKSMRYAI